MQQLTSPTWPQTLRALLPGVLLGAAYGLITRLAFDAGNGTGIWLTMTLAFLLLAPFGLGYLTVWLAPPSQRSRRAYAFWMPWLASLLLYGVVLLFKLEILICLIMAAPVFFLLAGAGGLTARSVALRRETAPQTTTSLAALIFLLPYLVAPLEQSLPVATAIRQVDTEIIIHAPVATVWENIKSVPTITRTEQRFDWLHSVGMPQPIAATLDHDGVGGVRNATFGNGLTFVETVTVWQPNQHIAFTIVPSGVAGLAPWNMIGGVYLDILDGAYTVEPLGEGRVRLLLTSRHRLSTRFNFYGGLWPDYVMRDLQNYILQVIKARCERSER
jgi:hypothetical protein